MEFMTLSQPHWEALTGETQEAYHLVSRLPFIQRYYLAGGTGLALHLGHRFSVDLDFDVLSDADENVIRRFELVIDRKKALKRSLFNYCQTQNN